MENILHSKQNNPHSRSNSPSQPWTPPQCRPELRPQVTLYTRSHVIPNSAPLSSRTPVRDLFSPTQSCISHIGTIRRISPIPSNLNSSPNSIFLYNATSALQFPAVFDIFPLKAWFKEAEKACWQSPDILKHCYPSASILSNNRVVFNIKGNKYRLITMINLDYGLVFIRFVGTHAEYDTIDATTI